MQGLYFLIPTLFTIMVSFLVVRAAGIALMLTGLNADKAKFQALSAFSGTGFTTKEAESVINHPIRRKIITWLMILGNAGIVTVIVASTSSFIYTKKSDLPITALTLVVGIFIIYRLATRKKLIMSWENFVEKRLLKRHSFEEGTTEDLLHFMEGYSMVKKLVTEESSLQGKTLLDFKLPAQGILVLGIERGRKWIPIPSAREIIQPGDRLIAYGAYDKLEEIFSEQKADSD